MTAAAFNQYHGFTLDIEHASELYRKVHVIDSEKSIYSSGRREGRSMIRTTGLDMHIDIVNARLMDAILDKVYQ